MRRGCISLGDIQCDGCHRIIPYGERYLAIEQDDGSALRYCVDCCLNQGYAHYEVEKGDQVLTFFL